MAYKQISPQAVTEGGTGISSNTAYTVLCGGTTATGAIQNVSSVGTTNHILTSNGSSSLPNFQQENSNNTAFVAYVSSTITNVTGDNTVYLIVFDSEEYDRNGNFNSSTGIFTAPITGLYALQYTLYLTGLISTHTGMANYTNECNYNIGNPYNMSTSGNLAVTGTRVRYMTQGQTDAVYVSISGGTKVVDILGGATSAGASKFSGFLIG